jgi:protein-L-isoaspartate(D-aspartate) O-methyltransferase
MVNDLVRRRAIRTAAVKRAFLRVPRHAFLTAPYILSTDPLLEDIEETDDACRVYNDQAVALTVNSDVSSCAPSLVALEVEQLAVADGMRVLHIGTGSGYCTAILADLAGERGTIVGVEYIEELAELSAGMLAQAGVTTATILHGDGVVGVPEAAPFDRILVSAGVTDIAPAWVRQLDAEGVLVLPLCPAGPLARRVSGGMLLTIQKSRDTLWGELSAAAFFVPLYRNLASAADASETLADGLARWLALEEFLRTALPIRIVMKPAAPPAPDPRSVPWLLETKNAVMWIAPS